MKNIRFVVFDVETTGLWPVRGDRVIEIGALAIEGTTIVDEFSTLIYTDQAISRAAQKIHSITKEMLAGKPKPDQVMLEFAEFIRESILVAHNAKFDVGFIRHEFRRQRFSFNHKHICTMEMSQERFPHLPNHKLDTVYRHLIGTTGDMFRKHLGREIDKLITGCPHHAISCQPELVEGGTCSRKLQRHRALGDARMTAAIWLAMEVK